ncbi:hypothetical protein [Novipirellula artificiosorum]|nr:hypothetical protein [Novipirellula artificiosorum]
MPARDDVPDIYYQRSQVFFQECQAAKMPFHFMVNSQDPHRLYCNPKKLTKGAAMPSIVKPNSRKQASAS